MVLVVGGIHQPAERHLEHLGDLDRIDLQRGARTHQADHRRDDEAGSGGVGRQAAEHLDLERLEADLLVRLAQRRRHRVGIARLGAAAGKADLSGMVVEVVGALRQQHRHLVAQHQRHQHRRVRRLALDEATLDLDLGLPERRLGEAPAQRDRVDARRRQRWQVRVDAEDRQALRIESRPTRRAGRPHRADRVKPASL